MSQAQKNQFEQQYNDALNGDREANKIPGQPASIFKDQGTHSGNEPMTQEQRAYLKTLSELHGEHLDENLTRAQAAELIDAKKQNITVPLPGERDEDFWNYFKTHPKGDTPPPPEVS